MDLDQEIKSNKIFILKKLGLNIFFALSIIAILTGIGHHQFPNIINISNMYYVGSIILLLTWITYTIYKYYKELNKYLDTNSVIRKIKQEEDAKKRIKFFILIYETDAEIAKEKLNILKSLSPIPFIIFLFTFVIDSPKFITFNTMKNILIDFNKISLEFDDVIINSSIVFVIYFVIKLRNTWNSYKSYQKMVMYFKNGLLDIENK